MIATEFPLADKRITIVKFGGPRYRPALAQEIQKNHPGTDLFSEYQGLVDPEKGDERKRYPIDERLAIYRVFQKEFHEAAGKAFPACEFPSVWEKLGLDWERYIARHVYQYSGR